MKIEIKILIKAKDEGNIEYDYELLLKKTGEDVIKVLNNLVKYLQKWEKDAS